MTPADLAVSLALPFALRLALLALRVAPCVWLLPFFGGRLLPVPTRLAVAALLALGLAPAVVGTPLPVTAAAWLTGWLLVAALRELTLGVGLALVIATPFLALEHAGRLLDAARGAPSPGSLSPETGAPASPLAELLRLTGALVFLAAGGHRGVLRALAASLADAPPSLAPAAPWHLAALADLAARWTAESLGAAATIAGAGLLALLATELVLGFAARLSPPLAHAGLALPARTLAPLAALALTAGLWTGATRDLAARALAAARVLLP